MFIINIIFCSLLVSCFAQETTTPSVTMANVTEPVESERTFSTKFVGEPIPANCTAFYSCCDSSNGNEDDCFKWCVKKVACNKRLILVKVPSYVEIATPAPEDLLPTNEEETTTDDIIVENPKIPKFGVKGVQIIDVPCRAGSLPDRRGRCREVW